MKKTDEESFGGTTLDPLALKLAAKMGCQVSAFRLMKRQFLPNGFETSAKTSYYVIFRKDDHSFRVDYDTHPQMKRFLSAIADLLDMGYVQGLPIVHK